MSKQADKNKQLLTVKEQEFYAFLRKLRSLRSTAITQAEMARRLKLPRQRVHHLLARLREKGWL